MGQMIIGVVLELWVILGMIGAALFAPAVRPAIVVAIALILSLPGAFLIVAGRHRIILMKRVGPAVIGAARLTGQIDTGLIARETGTGPDQVRLVAEYLVKRGAVRPDCVVS